MTQTLSQRGYSARLKFIGVLTAFALLSACGSAPKRPRTYVDGAPPKPVDLSNIMEPVPKFEPRGRYGNKSPYMVLGKTYELLEHRAGYVEEGTASWYGTMFHGRPTSTLEPYDMYQFTAAHKTLPLPTYARVTNLDNGRSIVVKINDRGPFVGTRLIDLSYVAALKLDYHMKGTARVRVEALTPGEQAPTAPIMVASRPATTQNSPRLSPAPAQANLLIQCGAFGQPANANTLAFALQNEGFADARTELGNDGLNRVLIGPLADEASRDELMLILQEAGCPSAKPYRR